METSEDGMNPPATLPQAQEHQPADKVGRSFGRVGVIVGLLTLAVAVGAVVVYDYMTSTRSPHMARYLPKDTLLYVEAPDPSITAWQITGMDVINQDAASESAFFDGFFADLGKVYDLDESEMRDLLLGMQGAAFGMRLMPEYGVVQYGVVLKFNSSDHGERLMDGRAMTKLADTTNAGHELWKIDSGSFLSDEGIELNLLQQMAIGYQPERNGVFAWFDAQSVAVFGTPGYIDAVGEVLEGDELGFDQNEAYLRATSQWQGNASVVSLIDPAAFKHDSIPENIKPFASDHYERFHKYGDPFTFSMKVSDRGMVTESNLPFAGDLMPPREIWPEAGSFELVDRLPSGTLGYVASRTSGLSWAKSQELMSEYLLRVGNHLDQMYGEDSDEFSRTIRDELIEGSNEIYAEIFPNLMQVEFGKGETLFAVIHDRPEDLSKIIDNEDELTKNFGGILLVECSDEVHEAMLADMELWISRMAEEYDGDYQAYKQWAEDARSQGSPEDGVYYDELAEERIGEMPTFTRSGSEATFQIEALYEAFSGQVTRLNGGLTAIVAAKGELLERALAALNGDGDMLADDAAWRGARSEISQDGQLEVFVDAGSILSIVFEQEGFVRDLEREAERDEDFLDPRTLFVIEGDERLVCMANLLIKADRDDELNIRMRELNMPGFGTLNSMPYLALFMVDGYIERAKAAEAETTIGSIKRNLEVYFTEHGYDAKTLADLERSGYIDEGGYDGVYYKRYEWTGGIANGRYVGTITGYPRNETENTPIVDVTYEADGTAAITRTSGGKSIYVPGDWGEPEKIPQLGPEPWNRPYPVYGDSGRAMPEPKSEKLEPKVRATAEPEMVDYDQQVENYSRAMAEIRSLLDLLETVHQRQGEYPESMQALRELNDGKVPMYDPWGNPWQYTGVTTADGVTGFELWTDGVELFDDNDNIWADETELVIGTLVPLKR